MYNVFEEAPLCKNVYKCIKLSKEGQNCIQVKDRPSRSTMMSTPEMVDSVNALTLADRKVIIEDISDQQGISVCIEHNSFA